MGQRRLLACHPQRAWWETVRCLELEAQGQEAVALPLETVVSSYFGQVVRMVEPAAMWAVAVV